MRAILIPAQPCSAEPYVRRGVFKTAGSTCQRANAHILSHVHFLALDRVTEDAECGISFGRSPQGRGPLSFPCEASRLVPIGSHLGASARCREVDDPFGAGVALARATTTPFAWGFVIIGVGLGLFLTLVLGPRPRRPAAPPRGAGPQRRPGTASRAALGGAAARGHGLPPDNRSARPGDHGAGPRPAAGPRGLAPSGTEGSGGGGTVPGMGLAPPQGTEGEERPYAIART